MEKRQINKRHLTTTYCLFTLYCNKISLFVFTHSYFIIFLFIMTSHYLTTSLNSLLSLVHTIKDNLYLFLIPLPVFRYIYFLFFTSFLPLYLPTPYYPFFSNSSLTSFLTSLLPSFLFLFIFHCFYNHLLFIVSSCFTLSCIQYTIKKRVS